MKLAAKLLQRLREEEPPVLVEAWFKDSQKRNIVRTAVEEVLDSELPKPYDTESFKENIREDF